MPNNFTIIDTVGQAYQNKLISFLEDFNNFELSDEKCYFVLKRGIEHHYH